MSRHNVGTMASRIVKTWFRLGLLDQRYQDPAVFGPAWTVSASKTVDGWMWGANIVSIIFVPISIRLIHPAEALSNQGRAIAHVRQGAGWFLFPAS